MFFALPGKVLFLAWPRKSTQKEGHPISAFVLRFAAFLFRSPNGTSLCRGRLARSLVQPFGLMIKALRCSDALKRDLKSWALWLLPINPCEWRRVSQNAVVGPKDEARKASPRRRTGTCDRRGPRSVRETQNKRYSRVLFLSSISLSRNKEMDSPKPRSGGRNIFYYCQNSKQHLSSRAGKI
jgi:hypothetical protein